MNHKHTHPRTPWPVIATICGMITLLAYFADRNGNRATALQSRATPLKAMGDPNAGSKQAIDVDKLADAIYIAEGGAKTKYPYGILTKYKKTTPRQACINTIKHAWNDWDGKGDFIAFLGSRYAPLNAKNDPRGLNKNWVKNVRRFYEHP